MQISRITVRFCSQQITVYHRNKSFKTRQHNLCLVLCRNVGFCFNILRMLMLSTVPKFAISQSEANSTVLISYDIRSLTWFCYRNAKFWAEFGYGRYLIVPFWYAWAAYQARLVSPWVFWLDYVSPKYEPWLNQTPSRLICHRSVPKRYD